MHNNYFDYIVYLALKIKANYDNKFFITTKQFHEFRINIINNIKKYCKLDDIDDEGFDNKVEEFIEFNKSIDYEAEKEYLKKFVSKNISDSFMEENIIGLNKKEPIKALKKIKIRIENYTDYYDEVLIDVLNHSQEDISNLNILDAKKKIRDIEKLFALESQIEELYETADTNNININYYKSIINDKLSSIYESSSLLDMASYLNIINSYLNDSEADDIYIKAIFSNSKLALYKINNYFLTLEYMKHADASYKYNLNILSLGVPKNYIGNYESNSEVLLDDDYDVNDINMLDDIYNNYNINYEFYSKYIELLDNYQNIYGSDLILENIKNRIFYLIESDTLEIEKSKYKSTSFQRYKKEVNKIIKNPKSKIGIIQGLYLITYYEFTKDTQVKKLLKECNIDYNKIIHKQDDKSFSDKVKRLIKKKKN